MTTARRINELFVWVGVGPDGQEQMLNCQNPILPGGSMPLVFTSQKTAERFREVAAVVCGSDPSPPKLLHFKIVETAH